MFRMGRNPKTPEHPDQPTPETTRATTTHAPTRDETPAAETADHTPRQATTAPPPSATNSSPAAATYERPSSTSRAVTEAESLAREIKEGVMSGFVGGGTVLTGEATFKGMLRVDGHLSGSVSSEKGTLIVSSGGVVDADVAVAVAKINGAVNGDIRATERIEMGRTARVNGDVTTPALVIEQGAIFEGNCHMRQQQPQPAAQAQTKQHAAAQPPSSDAPRPAATANVSTETTPVARPTSKPSNGQEKDTSSAAKTKTDFVAAPNAAATQSAPSAVSNTAS